jgi:hypothetical protein
VSEATLTYRKSRVGVYPLGYGWGWQVVAPDGTQVSSGGHSTKASAQKAARCEARFRDRLERDRVDGVVSQRTERILEQGVRVCQKCGEPHDLVAMTRRGRRFGQTWSAPDCGTYHPESWETLARRLLGATVASND